MSEPAQSFVANLFLNARVIGSVVEYWLQNHFEMTLLRGVSHPQSMSIEDLASNLIARVYQGVDDIVLVGQGGLALSSDSTEPRYVHYLNFVSPARGDFSLALPVGYFLTHRTKTLLCALLAVYSENEKVWQSQHHAATLGEHHCAFFRVDSGNSLAWRAFFSPLAYGLEIAYRLLKGLCNEMPPTWFYSETGGIAVARALLAALFRLRQDSHFAQDENVILASLREALEARLRNESLGAADRLSHTLKCLSRARSEMLRILTVTYQDMSRQLNRRFCLDDARSLPWQGSRVLIGH